MEKINSFLKKNVNNRFLIFLDKLMYRFTDHRVTEIGASLVYFAILSIFPFIIALLNLLNYTSFLESEQLFSYIKLLPTDIANIAYKFIQEISASSSSGLLSISIIAGLYTSSNIVQKLITNINLAYGFKDNRGFIKLRAMALLFTIALMLIIALVLISQVFGEIITKFLIKYLDLEAHTHVFIQFSFALISILGLFAVIALLYRLSPIKTAKKLITYKTVLPGAAFTTLGTILASQAFSFYVKNFAKYSVTYGSLAGIIIMLIWMWIIFIIILLGAEINGTIFSMKHFKEHSLWPRNDSVIKSKIKEDDMILNKSDQDN